MKLDMSLPRSCKVGIGRLEVKGALVGIVAWWTRIVFVLLLALPAFVVGQALNGLGICHPCECLGRRDKVDIGPAKNNDQ